MAASEVEAAASTILGGAQLLSCCSAVLAIMLVYLFQTATRSRRKSSCTPPPLPPGPRPWPVVGNLPEMVLNKPAFRWIHRVMKEMDADIACIKLGGVHVIPISCPKIAREVLKKQDANFASRPLTFASKIVSGGEYMDAVLCPSGEHCRRMRRVLTSEIICPSRHAWLHDKRADEANHLTAYVYNLATTAGVVNVRHVARHFCGNVIRRLTFNRRYFGEPQPDGGPGPTEIEYMDAMFTSLDHLFAFCVSDFLPCLLGLDLDGHEKIVKRANETVSRHQYAIIEERWRRRRERRDPEDLVDVLISLTDAHGGPVLSLEEVKALAQDITYAAVDNPSNAVEWAMAEMANKPEVMAKAVEEMDRVVGRDRLVQESDIPRLNYVKACVREAFRLHPVAAFNVPHVAMADTTVAGYRVPKGSYVILSRTGLGRNPRVWEDPLRFNPDRHMDPKGKAEVVLTENDLRFISFSTGRRGCIAAALGTATCIMLIGRLLQGFIWSNPAGVAAVDLSESEHDTFLANPLVLRAEPRLPVHLYPPISN